MRSKFTLLSFTVYRMVQLFLVVLLAVIESYAQPISISQDRFQIDNSAKVIVCNQLPVSSGGAPAKITFGQQEFVISGVTTPFEIGKRYTVTKDGASYALFFTNLPIIRLNTGNAKISETDDLTRGSITISQSSGNLFSSNMGVKVRGATSRTYPKKSYKIELSNDALGNDSRDASLLGLREDSEWLLLAMYNEPMRITNVTSHALWLKMHTLYYASKEPDANSAIRTRYCDVFANDTYLGVYAFTEDMDRKQLKLKKTGDNGEIRGEFYKADGWSNATTYATPLPAYNPNASGNWSGYEQKLPKDPYYWGNLYDYLRFVVNSPVEKFNADINKWLKLDNVVDYFLFLNLVRATDNTGKNVILARYKEGEPYFFIPWDLDGTFGYQFNAIRVNVTNDILTNGLFNRLMNRNTDGFNQKLRKRWFELRKNQLSTANLKKYLSDNNAVLVNEGAYEREKIKWSSSVDSEALPYMLSWVEQRVSYLDQYFATIPEEGAVVANFEGFLSVANCSTFQGWVWNSTLPNTPIEVEFFEGATILGTKLADTFRQDLKDARKGNGAHGYTFPTPDFLKDGKPHYISARVKNTGFVLKESFKTINCPGNGTGTPPPDPTNQPPQAPAVSPLSATINTGFSVTLPAFTDTDPLTYGLTGLPSGLQFSNRQITGSPSQSGSFQLLYWATDSQGASSSVSLVLTVHPASSGPVTVTGNFEGYLDKVECGSIRGWVWDRDKPNAVLMVEFFANGVSVGTIPADLYRQDLKDAGKGNGIHGYSFPTPVSLKNGTTYQVSAKVLNSTYVLKMAPKSLNCPSGSRVSGEVVDAESVGGLRIWPNPSRGRFEVGYELVGGQAGELSVVDGLGRIRYRLDVSGAGVQRQTIDLTGAQGIFVIHLRQGDRHFSEKLMIEK